MAIVQVAQVWARFSEISVLMLLLLKTLTRQVPKMWLAVIQQQGVQLTNLHTENGKLVIRGHAPSLDAANRVWDQIKLYPNYSQELMVDIKI